MILTYEFTYLSKNSVLENLLENIAKNADIEHFITKNNDKISLHARGEKKQLSEFSKILSDQLPYSIFLKSVFAHVTEAWDIKNASKTEMCDIFIPFTKLTADRAKKERNPFTENEIGQKRNIYQTLILEINKEAQKYDKNFGEVFEKAANIIKKGQKLNIKTLNGTFCVSLIENKIYDDFIVMPTDLSVADKIAVIKNEETNALASLEKPIIKTHTNMVFASKYPNFPRLIKLALAGDVFLYLLSCALFEKGVEFVALEQKDDLADASLYFEHDIFPSERVEVCVLQSGENVVVSGLSHIKPNILKNIKTLKNKHHTQFVAFMQELELLNSANCGIYLSLDNDDKVMFYDGKENFLDIFDISFEISIKKILNRIESEDDTGKRLIANYRATFPEILKNIENISFENVAQNVSNIWGVAALFLGFGNNLNEAKRKLLENIEIYAGDKGPRIDYQFAEKEGAKKSLNVYKFFRSVISFKLAGAENEMLSFGMAESLVHFLNDFCDKLRNDTEVENIILMGSLFGFKNIANLLVKNIGSNHKLFFGKELPLEI